MPEMQKPVLEQAEGEKDEEAAGAGGDGMIKSDDLSFAWSLTRSAEWVDGQETEIKACSIIALKMVYGKLKKFPWIFADAFNQTGWKFEAEFERREKLAQEAKA